MSNPVIWKLTSSMRNWHVLNIILQHLIRMPRSNTYRICNFYEGIWTIAGDLKLIWIPTDYVIFVTHTTWHQVTKGVNSIIIHEFHPTSKKCIS